MQVIKSAFEEMFDNYRKIDYTNIHFHYKYKSLSLHHIQNNNGNVNSEIEEKEKETENPKIEKDSKGKVKKPSWEQIRILSQRVEKLHLDSIVNEKSNKTELVEKKKLIPKSKNTKVVKSMSEDADEDEEKEENTDLF
ncbi:hypothetical protein RFI_01261 [Reticulomyxa filosa]|uniref:Uncharacterized protein n=1 Tax=Reticulomyxa filosa TaxID=46433 RepID=X6PCA0_RETFI|nr:hypothetical protein RFI_01261 [Reticulomyxa filosa]|eukprot:ETO35801.1 hypothetical protein RFI_01261 [Reticulomyxa filosa]